MRAVSVGSLLEIRRGHLDRCLAQRPAAGAKLLAGILEEMAARLRRMSG